MSDNILDKIGFFDSDGELTVDAINGQIQTMSLVSKAASLPDSAQMILGLLGIGIPAGPGGIDLSYLEVTTTLDEHEDEFPQFHGIYINFMSQATKVLNLNPVAVLKNFPGVHDPTQPIVDLFLFLQETFTSLIPVNVNIIEIALTKLDEIAPLTKDFCKFLQNVIDNANDLPSVDLTPLEEMIDAILNPEYPQLYTDIINQIQIEKEQVLQEVLVKAQELFGGFLPDIPDIEVPDPILSLDMIGFPGLPDFPISLFTEGPPPGVLRFLIDFLAKMVDKFTAKMMELMGIPTTAFDLLDALANGVEGLIDFVVNQLIGPIREALFEAWPGIEQHLMPACFFAALLITLVKILIVGLIGIMLGPGLISLGVAKALALV